MKTTIPIVIIALSYLGEKREGGTLFDKVISTGSSLSIVITAKEAYEGKTTEVYPKGSNLTFYVIFSTSIVTSTLLR